MPRPRGQRAVLTTASPMRSIPSYSPMPPMAGCRSSICSRSVVPERGSPTTMATPRTGSARGVNHGVPRAMRSRCSRIRRRSPSRSYGGVVAACNAVARSNASRWRPSRSRSCTSSKPAMRWRTTPAEGTAIFRSASTASFGRSRAMTRAAASAIRGSDDHAPPAATSVASSSCRCAKCSTSERSTAASMEMAPGAAVSRRSRATAASMRPSRWSMVARSSPACGSAGASRSASSASRSASTMRPRRTFARRRPSHAAKLRRLEARIASALVTASSNRPSSSCRCSVATGVSAGGMEGISPGACRRSAVATRRAVGLGRLRG